MDQNHLEALLKPHTQNFWFNRSLGWSPRNFISNMFPGTDPVGGDHVLRITALYKPQYHLTVNLQSPSFLSHCFTHRSSRLHRTQRSKSKRKCNLAVTQLLKGLQHYTSFQQLCPVSPSFPKDLKNSMNILKVLLIPRMCMGLPTPCFFMVTQA